MGRRREPERTCVGCRERAPRRDLLRLARLADDQVIVDAEGSAPGRGAYVHRNSECVDEAIRGRGIARALRAGLGSGELARLREEIERIVRT